MALKIDLNTPMVDLSTKSILLDTDVSNKGRDITVFGAVQHPEVLMRV